MKKLLLFLLLVQTSISSSFAQAMLFASPQQLITFHTNLGAASNAQSFQVNGMNLPNSVMISAPYGFELPEDILPAVYYCCPTPKGISGINACQ